MAQRQKSIIVGFCGNVPYQAIEHIEKRLSATVGGFSFHKVDFDHAAKSYVTIMNNMSRFEEEYADEYNELVRRVRNAAHETGIDDTILEYAEVKAGGCRHVIFKGIRFKEEADYVRFRGGVVYAVDPDEFPECDAKPLVERPGLELENDANAN